MESPLPVALVVDERLTSAPFRIGPGWLGDAAEIVVADSFDRPAAELLEKAVVILTAHRPVTAGMMAGAPRLRLVAKGGIGVDNIDVGAARERGIHVSNVPAVRSRAVAEHALHLVLAVARRAWAGDRTTWFAGEALQLEGRTLGILGLGGVGRSLAAMANGIGMEVVAANRTPHDVAGVELCDVETLFERSDAVVATLPATPETTGLVDRVLLERLPAHGIFVNVGRGPVVRTPDLVAVLESGGLGGAGLDVTDPEPLPPHHTLRRMDRVIITPHVAGQSDIANRDAISRFRHNITEVLAGRPPPDAV